MLRRTFDVDDVDDVATGAESAVGFERLDAGSRSVIGVCALDESGALSLAALLSFSARL